MKKRFTHVRLCHECRCPLERFYPGTGWRRTVKIVKTGMYRYCKSCAPMKRRKV